MAYKPMTFDPNQGGGVLRAWEGFGFKEPKEGGRERGVRGFMWSNHPKEAFVSPKKGMLTLMKVTTFIRKLSH